MVVGGAARITGGGRLEGGPPMLRSNHSEEVLSRAPRPGTEEYATVVNASSIVFREAVVWYLGTYLPNVHTGISDAVNTVKIRR